MTSHISSVMGFLTTSLHKNCQNDVKLLETWWFWPILGKVERAELTCDVIKKSCSTFLIKFWLYLFYSKTKTSLIAWFFLSLIHLVLIFLPTYEQGKLYPWCLVSIYLTCYIFLKWSISLYARHYKVEVLWDLHKIFAKSPP